MELRPYQEEVYNKTKYAFMQGAQGICCVLPCRSGKSFVMLQMAVDGSKKGNVLVLAHRRSLISQHKELFDKFNIDMTNIRIECVFTEVNHLGENGDVNLIIIDEAHLSEASSYRKVCEYYNCKRVLFTATPARLDGKPLTLADKLVEGISIKELIKMGAVSDFDYYAPDLKLDLENIDLVAGEYNNEQISEKMRKPAIYGDIFKYYKMLGEDRQAIAYCTNIAHSQEVCEMFNKNGISAIHMDAKTPEKQRAKILQDFKDNKFKILCNCNLISEGITLPTASVGLLLRPTLSMPLFIQQACRVLTPVEGKKAIIIDFVNNIEKHGLPTDSHEWSLFDKIPKRAVYDNFGNLVIKACQKCYKTYKGSLTACPYCGFSNIPTKKELENKKEIELKKISEEEAKQRKADMYKRKNEIWKCKTMSELVAYAKEKGYKNPGAWSYYILQSRKNKNKKGQK